MDLKSESIRLREFASQPPQEDLRGEVTAALHSKFEGIQAVAAEVLGSWGDAESKATLKHWLLDLLERPHGWAIRSVATRELARLVTPDDAIWVLDLYFGAEDALLQHEMWGLAAGLPPDPAKLLIDRYARDPDPKTRHSALKVLVRTNWGNPCDLLRPYTDDTDPLVRKLLKAWGAI